MDNKFFKEIDKNLRGVLDGKISFDDYVPDESPKVGEEVVGIISSQTTRSLFSLLKRLDLYIEDYQNTHSLNTFEGFMLASKQCKDPLLQIIILYRVIRDIFWAKVTEELQKSDNKMYDTLSVREGWKIVLLKTEPSSQNYENMIHRGLN